MTDMRTDDLQPPTITACCSVCKATYHGYASADIVEIIRSPDYEARLIQVLERDRRRWVSRHLAECRFGKADAT